MNCPDCGKEMVKLGRYRNKKGLWQRYKCQHCGVTKVSSEPIVS